MNKLFNFMLIISMGILSLSGFWSFSNDKCMTFKRGPVASSILCGHSLLILSILLLLISSYFSYLLYSSKSKVKPHDNERKRF